MLSRIFTTVFSPKPDSFAACRFHRHGGDPPANTELAYSAAIFFGPSPEMSNSSKQRVRELRLQFLVKLQPARRRHLVQLVAQRLAEALMPASWFPPPAS
jgi:hypothetical protein